MNSAPLLESGFQFRDVLAIIRKRFWTLAAVFLIPVILAAIWNFKATPIYRATVQLLIEPVDPKIVNIEEVQGRGLSSYTDYYATQHQILRSPTLARRAVGSLKLAGREGYGLPSR
ncbi:MAG: Wzz/FepE/Etk N-terminal domain-containing protein, partial [Chloroflexota bacterium]